MTKMIVVAIIALTGWLIGDALWGTAPAEIARSAMRGAFLLSAYIVTLRFFP